MPDAPPPVTDTSLADVSGALFAASPLAAYLRTPDGAFLHANQAMATLFGYADEADFLDAMAAVPEQFYLDPASQREVLDELAATGRTAGRQYQALCRDGFVLWVEESAQSIERTDDAPVVFGFLRDVTAEKSATWALREAEEKYRGIFENAVEGLFQMTPAGRFVTANAALARMLGFDSAKALVDHGDVQTLFVAAEDFALMRVALDAAGVVRSLEAECVRPDGTRMWGLINARAARDSHGASILYEGTLEDVTERRRSQELLRHNLAATSQLFHQTVKSLATTVRFRDSYTAGHQDNVARLASAIARRMRLSEDTVTGIRVAGQLHDIGKINIPVRYLCKPGRLTRLEWEFMKQHAATGYEILKDIHFPWPVAETVRAHHERLDGSGYPRGLGGEAIGLPARILAVADVLDAMASNRPYRPALGAAAACEEITRLRGKAFDPDAVDAALDVIRDGTIRY